MNKNELGELSGMVIEELSLIMRRDQLNCHVV